MNIIERTLLPAWERVHLLEQDFVKHMANLETLVAKIEDLVGTVEVLAKDVADLKAAKAVSDAAAAAAVTDQAAVDTLASKVGGAVDALKAADAGLTGAGTPAAPAA